MDERNDEEVPENGLLVREVGSWTADKLAILRCYLPQFGLACSKQAPRWNFVDAFAGPGINRVKDTGELVRGSPLIGLTAKPAFNKCLFVDLGTAETRALRQRVESYGDRAIAEHADVNADLVRLMHTHLDRRQPCVVFFDPEGVDLAWKTVEEVSSFRQGRFKTEVLILLPTHTGFLRMLPTEGDEAVAEDRLDTMFGTHEWHDIWMRRKRFFITKQQATTKYVELYELQLRRLGYRWTMSRLIRSRGRIGQPQYHLIFATDNEAGYKIMAHCFSTCFEAKQQSLLDWDDDWGDAD